MFSARSVLLVLLLALVAVLAAPDAPLPVADAANNKTVNTKFGELVSVVQHENRAFVAGRLGRIGSFWFSELKFDWSFPVPNPRGEPKQDLVVALWYRKGVLLSQGRRAVYAWHSRTSAKLWAFLLPEEENSEVLEAIFLDDNTVIVVASDHKVYELDKSTGAVRQTVEVNPAAVRYTVLRNDDDETKDLVESFADGRIAVSSIAVGRTSTVPRKEFKAADSEFAVVQQDGFLVHKRDTNRIVFTHVNSGGALPPHYFAENIVKLRTDHAGQSVVFDGKKTKTHCVVRIVNDTLQEWKFTPETVFTIYHPTNTAWATDNMRPVMRYTGSEIRQSMPSENNKYFTKAWHVQGDRKNLIFTVGDDYLLGFWRHIEGFNRLQQLWLLEQGPEQAEEDAKQRARKIQELKLKKQQQQGQAAAAAPKSQAKEGEEKEEL